MTSLVRLAAWGAMIGYALAIPVAVQAEPTKNKKDPNEVVCEKQSVLGSRLAAKRVCMTRAQWIEQRRADRDMVDKAQVGSCMKQSGC